MNEPVAVAVVKDGPDAGVYFNGIKVPGVLRVEPHVHGAAAIPAARITVAINSYALATEAPK